MGYQIHPDEEVRKAILRLTDALCSWERNTGIENILIIREAEFKYRALNGKPIMNHVETSDKELMNFIKI